MDLKDRFNLHEALRDPKPSFVRLSSSHEDTGWEAACHNNMSVGFGLDILGFKSFLHMLGF